MNMTHKDDQQRYREKQKKQGFVRMELWVKPEWKAIILDKLKQLKKN
jgi:hypothetical protein